MSNSAVETIRMPEVIVSAVHLDDPGSSTAGRTLWIMRSSWPLPRPKPRLIKQSFERGSHVRKNSRVSFNKWLTAMAARAKAMVSPAAATSPFVKFVLGKFPALPGRVG
jgi:hypothetical protein